MKRLAYGACALVILGALWGCSQALQRGMLGDAYVSTARPALMIEAKGMPLLAAGQGFCNMFWTGMLGGLPIQVWLAVYGEGGLAPMAITVQAQTPQGWYWDGIMRRPFSVDEGAAAFNGVTYDAYTYIVDPQRDPFGAFCAGVDDSGKPQLWIARAFAARYFFNQDKIILEYREPLPAGVTDLTALPMGHGDLLRQFAQRAKSVFTVAPAPGHPEGVRQSYIQGVEWQYMGQAFLGSVSHYDTLNFR